MPAFAKIVKAIHLQNKHDEIICTDNSDPEVTRWLDLFALRWEWGDATIDPENGKIIRRGQDYPEELWSGRVQRFGEPRGKKLTMVLAGNYEEILLELGIQKDVENT